MFQIGFFILIFLLGSIPFGFLISRYWLKIDIRSQGSGNIGMTNVMRVGGKWPGIVTFVLDFGKGSLAVYDCTNTFSCFRNRARNSNNFSQSGWNYSCLWTCFFQFFSVLKVEKGFQLCLEF